MGQMHLSTQLRSPLNHGPKKTRKDTRIDLLKLWSWIELAEYSSFEIQQDMGRDVLVRTDSQNDDGYLEIGAGTTLDRTTDKIMARAVVRWRVVG